MREIEEIMKDFQVQEHLIGETLLSDREKEEIFRETCCKAGLAPGKKKRRMPRRRLMILAAACALMFVLVAGAFAAAALNPELQDLFRPSDTAQRQLLNDSGTIIDQKVTANGVTIHVREAIGDQNVVYVLYDVIAPEGTALDQPQYYFARENISVSGGLPLGGYGSGWHSIDLEDDNPADNKISRILSFSASRDLAGKTLDIDWTDLSYYTGGAGPDDSEVLVSGEWKISFPLNYKDQSTAWKVNQKVDLGDHSNSTIRSIRISPISVTLTLDSDSRLPYERTADLILRTKGGEEVTYTGGGSTSSGSKIMITQEFDRVIPWEDIESIQYYNVTIPVR